VCVTRKWAGVDSVREQEKHEATLREMFAVGAARRPFGRQSPASSALLSRCTSGTRCWAALDLLNMKKLLVPIEPLDTSSGEEKFFTIHCIGALNCYCYFGSWLIPRPEHDHLPSRIAWVKSSYNGCALFSAFPSYHFP
jgi:hypothetical protein